ncbi:hypothetical protein GQ600_21776 [Phytophthora cactorum]|nr:hypothetical protein GQ600_21776 [Phytophthora cactorum]
MCSIQKTACTGILVSLNTVANVYGESLTLTNKFNGMLWSYTDVADWDPLPPNRLAVIPFILSSAHKDLRIMKFSLFIAALVGIAIQATDASTHLRVHILTELASAGQQCEWENKAVKCDSATFCQKSDKHTGYCMKKKPGLGDQCGDEHQGSSGTLSAVNIYQRTARGGCIIIGEFLYGSLNY